MELSESQHKDLTRRAREIVDALDAIAGAARVHLSGKSPVRPQDVVAVPIKTLTGNGTSALIKIDQALKHDRAGLARLASEPFVARVVVQRGGERRTYYVSRGPVAGASMDGARLVNYGAALGRLAEQRPGNSVTVRLPHGAEEEVLVEERVRLRPTFVEGAWDAEDTSFQAEQWDIVLSSLRALLDQAGAGVGEDAQLDVLGQLLQRAAEEQLARDFQRREVIEHISLRDQPILDAIQGEIFRLPLNRKLLLLGPPGTGKTTTLIKRLGNKRLREQLGEDDVEFLERRGLTETFLESRSWAMFAPTDLLRLYLQDAFNREGVPATGSNIRTWNSERLHLGRNVLNVLRTPERSGFQLEQLARVLRDENSVTGARLFERFSEYVEEAVQARLESAFEGLEQEDADLWKRVGTLSPPAAGGAGLPRRLLRVVDRAEVLQPDIKRLDGKVDAEVKRIGNVLLRRSPTLLDELVAAMPGWASDTELSNAEDRDDEDFAEGEPTDDPSVSGGPTKAAAAQVLMGALGVYARGVASGRARPRGRAGKVFELLGERTPSREDVEFLGRLLALRQQLRSVVQAPRAFVMGVPAMYRRFRRASIDDPTLYGDGARELARQNRISGAELDVVILTMLRNARLLLQPDVLRGTLANAAGQPWLEGITSQYVHQVFVDEATDFSVVQLGCMMELCHPAFRSWFACGDFMQRITSHGAASPREIEWLERLDGEAVEVRKISVGYRQTASLRALTVAVAASLGQECDVEPPEFESAHAARPLLLENATGATLGEWLGARIVEVERRLGVLPSIAVFVNGDDQIDPLVAALRPILERHNLDVVGCPGGRVVGEDREVRVFDVRHIKGLEFEAVFFVGVDRLHESLGSLFGQLFYVGASRAAVYLGISAERSLPTILQPLRGHFAASGWGLEA